MTTQYDAAEHIFEWARNDATLYQRMVGLSKYHQGPAFNTATAGLAFSLATETYRAMLKGNEIAISEVAPFHLFEAAKRFLEFQAE